MVRLIQIFILLFFFQSSFSQDELSIFSDVDSTSIKVGQQFTFSIKVESENIEGIMFPEKYNFSPFEIAEEFKLDTTFFKGKKSLEYDSRIKLIKDISRTKSFGRKM